MTEVFGQYWAIAMGVISLIAAVIAFYGSYLRVRQLESLRRPGIGGFFIYGLVLAFSFGIGRGLPFLIAGLFSSAVSKLAKLIILATKKYSDNKWICITLSEFLLFQTIRLLPIKIKR